MTEREGDRDRERKADRLRDEERETEIENMTETDTSTEIERHLQTQRQRLRTNPFPAFGSRTQSVLVAGICGQTGGAYQSSACGTLGSIRYECQTAMA